MRDQEIEFDLCITVQAPSELSSREVLDNLRLYLEDMPGLIDVEELEWRRTKSGED